jgi:hypothetical protein
VSQWIAKNLFKVFVNFVKKYRGVKWEQWWKHYLFY